MAFGSFANQPSNVGRTMSEINMVPLIDVVLVLLVLFILAAPMAAQSIQVNLPKTVAVASQEQPKTIDITLNAQGDRMAQDGQLLNDDQMKALFMRVQPMQGQDANISVRIWSDQDVRYAHLAELIAFIRNAGVNKVSLMTRMP
jgi:biopolymer transport protein ExbD